MDLVYFCKPGPNEELRYSIRSAIRNLPHDNIWIVGGKPDWYTGNFIEVPASNAKYKTVRTNIYTACNTADISDDFILMNDDFYILEPIQSLEYFFSGTLKDKIEQRLSSPNGVNTYTALLENTYWYLKRYDKTKEPLDYELHVPMIMNKKKLLKIVKLPHLWRSLYGNIHNVGGTQMQDVKVYNNEYQQHYSYDYLNDNSPFLSSEDDSFEILLNDLLANMFNEPSIYESPR